MSNTAESSIKFLYDNLGEGMLKLLEAYLIDCRELSGEPGSIDEAYPGEIENLEKLIEITREALDKRLEELQDPEGEIEIDLGTAVSIGDKILEDLREPWVLLKGTTPGLGRVKLSGEAGEETISILLGPEKYDKSPVVMTIKVERSALDVVSTHGIFAAMGNDMIRVTPKVLIAGAEDSAE